MGFVRRFVRSRKRRHHARSSSLDQPALKHHRSAGHTPRLTRLYMSVPGSRGGDDRILIVGGVVLLLILGAVGVWVAMNAPRDNRVSVASHAETRSVRLISFSEANGMAEIRYEDHGEEYGLSIPSGNPLVTDLRKAKPGDVIIVPKRSEPLYEVEAEGSRKKTPAAPDPP